MGLPSAYLTSTKNVPGFFNALQNAQAPDTFTQKFLLTLDFKSSSDRLFIGILKAVGFSDENSKPTPRYFRFLDQSISKQVLAEGIREGYSDLFQVNKNANTLDNAAIKNKLKTILEGKPSDAVLSKMAATFHALCEYADWGGAVPGPEIVNSSSEGAKAKRLSDEKPLGPQVTRPQLTLGNPVGPDVPVPPQLRNSTQLHYNIQIHLPETRDQGVYDAIFKSLRSHLL